MRSSSREPGFARPRHCRHRACRLFLAWLALGLGASGSTLASTVQHVALDGQWRHWVDETNYEIITVPFSVPPVGAQVGYEKLFTVPAGTPTNVMLLYFHGVVGQCKVYLNGVLLGEHGSYTPFWFDVSSLLDPNGENDLAVVIDDRLDVTTVPYSDIPWVNYSGIIRGVELLCADRAILLASRPRYSFTMDLRHVDGEVTVQAFAPVGTQVDFAGAILAKDGVNWFPAAILNSDSGQADSAGIASATLSFSFDNPVLWSPEFPYLYYLYLEAGVYGEVADNRLVATGFRDVRVEGNDILLNGQPLLLRGTSYHGIFPGPGFVGTEEQMFSDLSRIKATGANYVRMIHYPQNPRLLDIADEIGLLVSEEIPAWANFWDSNVQQKLYAMLGEMIRRDMHHPSIFLWITGNARAYPMPYTQQAVSIAKNLDRNRLASYIIDNDEYDPDTIAQDVAFYQAAGLDLYMKISWWFYYVEYLQDAWANFPKDIPIIIAEFGREGNNREPIVVDGDQQYWMGEDQQSDAVSEMLEAWRPHLPQYDANEHITGLIYYNYQDLDWPDIQRYLPNHIKSIHHGLVYADCVPKLVLQTLTQFYSTLPSEYVGLPEPQDQDVERLFNNPSNLTASLNGAYRDAGPSLSFDGKTLYFASDGPDYVGLPKLFYSQLVDNAWSTPQLIDMPQESEPFAFRQSPCISFDGQTLYFTRAVVSGIYVACTRIWASRLVDGVWADPEDLGDVVNYPDAARITSNPSISANGESLFFGSDRPGGYGRTDLWVSRRVGGQWGPPENLGATVNTAAGESEPSISADGKTLYFSSDRLGGVGSSDIWVTHWANGAWTVPKNLGPELNSPGADREPEVSKDGRKLLFTGIRSGGEGLSDVWTAATIFAPTDFDHDGDADQDDFAHLQRCVSGSGIPQTDPICLDAYLNDDTVVDENDILVFETCASGPAIFVDPSCGAR